MTLFNNQKIFTENETEILRKQNPLKCKLTGVLNRWDHKSCSNKCEECKEFFRDFKSFLRIKPCIIPLSSLEENE